MISNNDQHREHSFHSMTKRSPRRENPKNRWFLDHFGKASNKNIRDFYHRHAGQPSVPFLLIALFFFRDTSTVKLHRRIVVKQRSSAPRRLIARAPRLDQSTCSVNCRMLIVSEETRVIVAIYSSFSAIFFIYLLMPKRARARIRSACDRVRRARAPRDKFLIKQRNA